LRRSRLKKGLMPLHAKAKVQSLLKGQPPIGGRSRALRRECEVMSEPREMDTDTAPRPRSRTGMFGIAVGIVVIGTLVGLFTCMRPSGGMDVRIENETADMASLAMVRTTCDVINYGDPGNVTIVCAVQQGGKEKDKCEQEIHLNKGQVMEIFFYLDIDPEAGEYTYDFEARNLKPD